MVRNQVTQVGISHREGNMAPHQGGEQRGLDLVREVGRVYAHILFMEPGMVIDIFPFWFVSLVFCLFGLVLRQELTVFLATVRTPCVNQAGSPSPASSPGCWD